MSVSKQWLKGLLLTVSRNLLSDWQKTLLSNSPNLDIISVSFLTLILSRTCLMSNLQIRETIKAAECGKGDLAKCYKTVDFPNGRHRNTLHFYVQISALILPFEAYSNTAFSTQHYCIYWERQLFSRLMNGVMNLSNQMMNENLWIYLIDSAYTPLSVARRRLWDMTREPLKMIPVWVTGKK